MKLKKLWLIPLLFSSATTFAKVDVSPLFIQLSDAMAEMKKGEFAKSQQNLTALEQSFLNIEQNDSTAGVLVKEALDKAIKTPNADNLETLAKNLYAFEKEQNPVDYRKKQQEFIEKMTPLYVELNLATQTKEIDKIKQAARNFGKNWAKYEKSVREMSLTHYGQFERILGLMRIVVTAEKPDLLKIEERVTELGNIMQEFSQFVIK
ncbi:Fe2+/Pb2+ permease [Mannheimia sp. AT1]|uniref:Fe2+/Pb2+ permease n=1 Tax=Mannheimia cairinae TaxID=3025936 RepID=A0ABT5MS78_9PAST|nr:Fe2+/Pb2+ permease [Mannheimia cairinae]MDD0824900.1 Fe2+/Pb2+ permease [Mannheimia cairinae]MDD0826170.1 Fe2+/Pb2+ permease [Mannheimia cairinae]